MTDIPQWTIREARTEDAAALALIGAATFLETFAGILDGDAIVGHCAAQHSEAAYRACYPDATQEDIDRWVWDPDAEAPPLVPGTLRLWDLEPEERRLSPLAAAS